MSKQHFDATTFITENLTPLFYAATHHQELFLNFLFTQIQKDIKNGQFVEATIVDQLCAALGINKMMLLPGAGIRECTNTYTECALALLKGMQNLPQLLGHGYHDQQNQKMVILQNLDQFYQALISWSNSHSPNRTLSLHTFYVEGDIGDWDYVEFRTATDEAFETCKAFIDANLSDELFLLDESDANAQMVSLRGEALTWLHKVYKTSIRLRQYFRMTDVRFKETWMAALLAPAENLERGQKTIQILLDTLEKTFVVEYTLPKILDIYQEPLRHVSKQWIAFARHLAQAGTLHTEKPLLPDYLADRAETSTSTERARATNARIRDNAVKQGLRIEIDTLREINGENSPERAARRAPSIFPTVDNSPTVKAEGDVVAATGPEVGPDSPTT